MNAISAFENRKETLLAQLEEAQSAQEAMTACQMALEQTACELAQNEQDETGRQRQQAVMALCRSVPQLLRAAGATGELVLAEPSDEDAPKKRPTARQAMQGAGAFLLAALAVHELLDGQTLFALLQLAGGALLVLGGLKHDENAQTVCPYRARGVVQIDAQEMVRQLAQLCRAVDVCTSDLTIIAREAGAVRLSGTADEAMLDLLGALMEAKTSGRDELAMRSLNQAEQYLRMLGVEIVPYNGENAALYDALPTLGEARTIRPAMVKDGKLLRRGVTACPVGKEVRG